MIEIVAATRLDRRGFAETPLGYSLQRVPHYRGVIRQISYSNIDGLSQVYNRRILADSPDDILIFTHDDVWIEDFFFPHRVIEALRQFQIVGIVGNTRLVDSHVGWGFKNRKSEWDFQNLSGAIGHGVTALAPIDYYGECPKPCELMDGVFLAARRSVLRASNTLFDPQFLFHFYDLDFCRTARRNGLLLGTWPISIFHKSAGSFSSAQWKDALETYKRKWPERTEKMGSDDVISPPGST